MILGLQGYDNGTAVLAQAKEFAIEVMEASNATNHFKRQFEDKITYDRILMSFRYNLTESWSLKYNLLYQYILNQDVFPQARFASSTFLFHSSQLLIETDEMFYNEFHLNPFGVPLDDRATFTKTGPLS